jgi:uncharacterized protein YraI
MRNLLKALAFSVGLLTATGAMAASALVTTDLNVRTGPSTGYPPVGVLPNGAIVDVVGCTSGYSWCRVNYGGLDGWASSAYLAHQTGSYAGSTYAGTAATIGIPLIAGVVIGGLLDDDDDWDDHRHWRHRDWDDRWDRWERRDRRADRREWRRERREARREWRRDRREDRREWRRLRNADNLFEERRWMRDDGGC